MSKTSASLWRLVLGFDHILQKIVSPQPRYSPPPDIQQNNPIAQNVSFNVQKSPLDAKRHLDVVAIPPDLLQEAFHLCSDSVPPILSVAFITTTPPAASSRRENANPRETNSPRGSLMVGRIHVQEIAGSINQTVAVFHPHMTVKARINRSFIACARRENQKHTSCSSSRFNKLPSSKIYLLSTLWTPSIDHIKYYWNRQFPH